MPSLRVDPALLGQAPAPTAPQAAASQPPIVEDRAAIPPLYSAQVAASLLPDPVLKSTTTLSPVPRVANEAYPVFLAATRITSQGDTDVVAEGDTELRKSNITLSADRQTYNKIEDEVEAVGNARLTRDADVMVGPKMRYNLTDSTGFVEQPKYAFTRPTRLPAQSSSLLPAVPLAPLQVIAGEIVGEHGPLITSSGAADRLEFQGVNRMQLTNATYSTCRPEKPDWYVQASDLSLDYDHEEGVARHARVMFQGLPLFYSPWLPFSLSNARKSGLLAPTFGASSNTGTELTAPYYWNIAPNMDATIAPRIMTKRGVQLNGEYRYLEANYSGELHGEWLPDDAVAHRSRSAYAVLHTQNFGYGFTGSLNLNGVSDDTYLTDLATRISRTSQINMLRQGILTYSGGGWWSATANVQRYQTLQDPAQPPVATPYDRAPQLTLTANRPDVYGAALAFNGEYVDFRNSTLVTGRRTTLYPQVSFPWQAPGWYVTPKLGYHMTRYDLSSQAAGVPDRISRNLPIFSVDSGLIFERDATWGGKNVTQTLEPRLYYLNVPKRDQSLIPNFDTGFTDFNFATIFSENVFAGGDRIADANQVTAALTSRLIDPQTGQEYLRGLIGQRYYFNNQEVTLPGVPARPGGASDFLAALSGRVADRAYIDSGWQYNPRDRHTERFTVGARWQPDFTKALNASYRYTRDSVVSGPGIRQIDLAGQWPIANGWYAVGRYNYSLRDKRLVESVGGLEYDGGCWIARFVVQRFATTSGTANTAFFLQLELNGLSSVGSNPLELLKRNIPGYGMINQPTADPAFGAQ